MNFFLYPSKDTTIYKQKKLRLLNSGSDEVIELTNNRDDAIGHDLSRILMQFDVSGLASVKNELSDARYMLNLKLMTSSELLPLDELEVYPLRKSWKEGNGRFVPSADSKNFSPGANWKYTDGVNDMWVGGSHHDSTGGGVWYDRQVCRDISINQTDIDCTFKFTKRFSDVKVDITKIVNYWLEGNIPNNGLVIKFKNEEVGNAGNVKFYSSDTNTIYYPYIQVSYNDYFFNPCQKRKVKKLVCPTSEISAESISPTPTPSHHSCPESGSLYSGSIESGSLYLDNVNFVNIISGTIESGTLEVSTPTPSNLFSGSLSSGTLESGVIENTHQDISGVVETNCIKSPSSSDAIVHEIETVEVTSTLNQVMSSSTVPHIKRIKKEFRTKSRERLSVGIRDKFPTKTFSSKSAFDLNNYTMSEMKYSVRDAETDGVIIDFSKYSRISCDSNGHYFNFDFTCLPVGRIYKFLIMIESDDGVEIHADKRRFIVRS